MTDEEILAAARRIRARRKDEARLASFGECRGLMIRWDVPGAPFGESYVSVEVTADEVRDVVEKKLRQRIAANAR
ncbi:MAG: hypothetical protein AAFM92_03310 [Pseudomonadota bacterium]